MIRMMRNVEKLNHMKMGVLCTEVLGVQSLWHLDVHISQTFAGDALNQIHFPTYVMRCLYPRINKCIGNMHCLTIPILCLLEPYSAPEDVSMSRCMYPYSMLGNNL